MRNYTRWSALILAGSLAACSATDITSAQKFAPTMVSVGASFSCGLKGGVVKCWGAGSSGQLGNGANADSATPVTPLNLPSIVTGLSGGSAHACVIARGGVRCWGDNTHGQIGLAAGANYNLPQVPNFASFAPGSTVGFLASGLLYNCAIAAITDNTTGPNKGTFTGTVSCWGEQQFGALGNAAVAGPTTVATPATNAGLAGLNFVNLALGDQHGCAVASGAAYCWGSDSAGELEDEVGAAGGSGTAAIAKTLGVGANVQMVAAGLKHSCAVVNTGVKCWGDNSAGQLGNNSTVASLKPVDVQGLAGTATAVFAGGNSSCAVAGGQLQCWGANSSGQLGDGTTTNRLSAVSTGLSGTVIQVAVATTGHTCAAVDGTIYCWGGNGNGQLGNGSTSPSQTPSAVSF